MLMIAAFTEPATKPTAVSITANNRLDLFIELTPLLTERIPFSHVLSTEAKIFQNFCFCVKTTRWQQHGCFHLEVVRCQPLGATVEVQESGEVLAADWVLL